MTVTHDGTTALSVSDEERRAIEADLTRLNNAFAYFMDAGDFESMIALFTPDCVFDRAGTVHHGHEEIREGMRERPKVTTRHLLANFYLTGASSDEARAVVCSMVHHGPLSENGEAVVFATANGRVMEFDDTYVKTADGWRIRSRIARAVLRPEVWP